MSKVNEKGLIEGKMDRSFNKSDILPNAVCYYRSSSSFGPEKSIQAQRNHCSKFCAEEQITIVKEFVDFASGYRAQDRMNKVLSFCREEDVDFLVFSSISRITPRLSEYINLEDEFLEIGVVSLSISNETGESELSLQEEDIVESVRRAETVHEDLLLRRCLDNTKSKNQVPQYLPLGYSYREQSDTIIQDIDTAPVIQKIFQKFAYDNFTLGNISGLLSGYGFINGASQSPYSEQDIRNLLSEQMYIGSVDRRSHHCAPANIAKPIVDEYTFMLVRKKLDSVSY